MPYTTKGRICVTSSIISPIFSFDYLPVVDSYTCRLYQMYADPKSPHPNWTHSQHLVLYLLPASFQNLILLLTDIRSVDYYATISDESFCLVSSNQNQNTWFPCEKELAFHHHDIQDERHTHLYGFQNKNSLIGHEHIRFDIRIDSPTR